MARKSVSSLMNLKADVRDFQEELHEAGEALEQITFDIQNMTTEEIRSDTGGALKDMLKRLRQTQKDVDVARKALEKAVKKLRTFL